MKTIFLTNRGAVQFRIAPVVRGKGTGSVFATAVAVELSLQMFISDLHKNHQSGIFIGTKEKGEDTEDTKLDVDGAFIVHSFGVETVS